MQASARAQRMLAGAKEAVARNAAQRSLSAAAAASSGTPEGVAVDMSVETPNRRPGATPVAAVTVGATTPALRNWAFGQPGDQEPPPSTAKKVRQTTVSDAPMISLLSGSRGSDHDFQTRLCLQVRFSLDYDAQVTDATPLQAPTSSDAFPVPSPCSARSSDGGPLAPSCTPLSSAAPARRDIAQAAVVDLQLVASKLGAVVRRSLT